MNSFIDDVMGFDGSNLDVFQEKPQTKGNVNIYKTNPVDSKSEDGHYHCRLRIIYNPFNLKRSIVHQAMYVMRDAQGLFFVKSALGDGDRNCPIFNGWKALHFSGDEKKKTWGDSMYEKNETDWCLVQILEDDNKPELVGAIRAMKLPSAIYSKLKAKMNPSADSKKTPVPIMDYLIGLPVDMDVTPGPDDPKNPQRKQREISYDLCEFDTEYAPIMKIDGTPLFTDEELETIDAYNEAKNKVNKAKTDKAKADAQKELTAIVEKVKPLYQKALDYLKGDAHVLDLEAECGYTPWSPELSARVANWINTVAAMKNPATTTVGEAAPEAAAGVDMQEDAPVNEVDSMAADDLPF